MRNNKLLKHKLREIKFRAYDGFTKKMWQWEEHNAFTDEKGSIKQWFEDHDLVQMQYIGLKDKNGKEIYECDLVRFYIENVNTLRDESFIGKIIYDEQQARYIIEWENVKYFPDIILGLSKCKVIGNIYENPELLEV